MGTAKRAPTASAANTTTFPWAHGDAKKLSDSLALKAAQRREREKQTKAAQAQAGGAAPSQTPIGGLPN